MNWSVPVFLLNGYCSTVNNNEQQAKIKTTTHATQQLSCCWLSWLHLFLVVGASQSTTEPTPELATANNNQQQIYIAQYFGGRGRKNNNNNNRQETNHTIGQNLIRHRARQRLFYYKCMKHIKSQGRDWTLLTDSDEFLYVNYDYNNKQTTKTTTVVDKKTKIPPQPAMMSMSTSTSMMPITQEGSVLSVLKSTLQQQPLGHSRSNLTRTTQQQQPACIQIPRIRFGGTQSSIDQVQKQVPSPFMNSTNLFLTLAWRKHAHPDDYGNNRISKVLIDLSRVPWEELKPVDSIHRPIWTMCGQHKLHIKKS
jgi:hypothetical protein